MPPEGIKLNQSYQLNDLLGKFTLNELQSLFMPVGEWNWSDLEENENEKSNRKNKRNRSDNVIDKKIIENIEEI